MISRISSVLLLVGVTGAVLAGQPDRLQQPAPYAKQWYAGGAFGVAIPGGTGESSADTGFDLGGQAGYRFNRNFRVEGSFYYYRNSNVTTTLPTSSLTTLMANGYFDYPLNYGVTPFVGVGIGWGHFYSGVGPWVPSSSNVFAYQGLMGLSYYLNVNIALQMTYHILSWTNGGGHMHVIDVGFNYFFA